MSTDRQEQVQVYDDTPVKSESMTSLIPLDRESLTSYAYWGGGGSGVFAIITLAFGGGGFAFATALIGGAFGILICREGIKVVHTYVRFPRFIDEPIAKVKERDRKRDLLRSKSGRTWQERLAGVPADPKRLQREMEATQTIESTVSVVPEPEQESRDAQEDEEARIFTLQGKQIQSLPCERITLEQIVAHIERNSYEMYIGRSLTLPGYPARKISFHKRHLKALGASQKGKSTKATLFIDAVSRTHDPSHVQFALLDLEDLSGQPYTDLPHIARIRNQGRDIKLHARTPEEVLEYLGYCVALLNLRRSMPITERLKQPLLIVFIEEFLYLKDYFKKKMIVGSPEEKEQGKVQFYLLISRIKTLASLGLKNLIQLFICAQVEYADPDLAEALANVVDGFSYCLEPSVARAAGFQQTKLLNRNYELKQPGVCVIETVEFNDLILSPFYDLPAMIEAAQNQGVASPHVIDISTAAEYEMKPSLDLSIQEEERGEVVLPTPDLLQRALEKYDQGYRTQPALANALGMTPWTVRPVYAQVKMLRPSENVQGATV